MQQNDELQLNKNSQEVCSSAEEKASCVEESPFSTPDATVNAEPAVAAQPQESAVAGPETEAIVPEVVASPEAEAACDETAPEAESTPVANTVAPTNEATPTVETTLETETAPEMAAVVPETETIAPANEATLAVETTSEAEAVPEADTVILADDTASEVETTSETKAIPVDEAIPAVETTSEVETSLETDTASEMVAVVPETAIPPANETGVPAVETGDASAAKRRKKKWNIVLNVVLWAIVAALALAVVLRLFVFGSITVSGDSMTSPYYKDTNPELTFHSGDVVTVNKTLSPSRGDVAVFYKHHVDNKFLAMFAGGADVQAGGKYEKLIKRVVALAGDKLWLEERADGKYNLVIETPDGQILREDHYTKNGVTLSVDAFAISSGYGVSSDEGRLKGATQDNPYVVADGCFFAMGDNRVNSADSRGSLGDVPLEQVYGIVY